MKHITKLSSSVYPVNRGGGYPAYINQLLIASGLSAADISIPELNRSFLLNVAKSSRVDQFATCMRYGVPAFFADRLSKLYYKEQNLITKVKLGEPLENLPLREFIARGRIASGLLFKLENEQQAINLLKASDYEMMDASSRPSTPEDEIIVIAYLSAVKRMLSEPGWLNSQFVRIATGLSPELLFYIEQRSDFSVMRAALSGLKFKLRVDAEDLLNVMNDSSGITPLGKKSMMRLIHTIINDTPEYQHNNTFIQTQTSFRSPIKTDFKRQLTAISPSVTFGSNCYAEKIRNDTIYSPDMTVLSTLYAYGCTVRQAQKLLPDSYKLCRGRFQTVHDKMNEIGMIPPPRKSTLNQLKLSYGYALGILLFTMLDKIVKTVPTNQSGYPHPFTYIAVYTYFVNRICYDLYEYDKAGNRSTELWRFPSFLDVILNTRQGKTIIEEVKCPRCGRRYLAIRNTPKMYACPFCRGSTPVEERQATPTTLDALLNRDLDTVL